MAEASADIFELKLDWELFFIRTLKYTLFFQYFKENLGVKGRRRCTAHTRTLY